MVILLMMGTRRALSLCQLLYLLYLIFCISLSIADHRLERTEDTQGVIIAATIHLAITLA